MGISLKWVFFRKGVQSCLFCLTYFGLILSLPGETIRTYYLPIIVLPGIIGNILSFLVRLKYCSMEIFWACVTYCPLNKTKLISMNLVCENTFMYKLYSNGTLDLLSPQKMSKFNTLSRKYSIPIYMFW